MKQPLPGSRERVGELERPNPSGANLPATKQLVKAS